MTVSFKPRQWDIFCKVIDNFGDIGICWRLAIDLASRGQTVRLWADDASALAWMAPSGCAGVEVLRWTQVLHAEDLAKAHLQPPDVLVEAFGCEIASEFIAQCADGARATGIKPVWINLEYLSAEPYVERCHGLPSPVQSGPAAGWTKHFFYPGFSERTGGLLREPDLTRRQAQFDSRAWLQRHGLTTSSERAVEKQVSLFCYEPAALPALLAALMQRGLEGQPVRLLVAAGRAERAVQAALRNGVSHDFDQKTSQPTSNKHGLLSLSYLPLLSQQDFDHLLWSCDLNFVRGEDSLVRAIWAGKPFVWQTYPQVDNAHTVKLDAFLQAVKAPPTWGDFHRCWSMQQEAKDSSPGDPDQFPELPPIDLKGWARAVARLRSSLLAQTDLGTQLLMFTEKNS